MAQMYAVDLSGNHRPDIITSLNAHGYGLAWYEQKEDGTFEKHLIMGEKTEENATAHASRNFTPSPSPT